MLSKTVSYNGATLHVRREDVRARLLGDVLLSKFVNASVLEGLPAWCLTNFVRFITQCTVEGELGFAVPSVMDDEKTIHVAFEAFLASDSALIDVLRTALNDVDADMGDPALSPDTKKKTTPKSESEENAN
jgi:hypothetical protein